MSQVSYEVQGVLYCEQEYLAARVIEEAAAQNFTLEYQQEMYRAWLVEPTVDDLRRVLTDQKVRVILAKAGQTVEGVIRSKPFSPQRYLDVMQSIIEATPLNRNTGNTNCPLCLTPKVSGRSIFGKNDSGMRCGLNHFHLAASMALEVMGEDRKKAVFLGTWLERVLYRTPVNMAIVDPLTRIVVPENKW